MASPPPNTPRPDRATGDRRRRRSRRGQAQPAAPTGAPGAGTPTTDTRSSGSRTDASASSVRTPSTARASERRTPPVISYPPELPVTEHRQALLDAIDQHQVVIVAGETGSGKSTQLPKLCLELGRGVEGMIAHTQPRRIAARSIAERVAQELEESVGQRVGYSVRFTDQVSDATMVRVMTDGLLLAEIQRDRDLRRYDTIIVDEAHERSLNIDFLLGYLRQLIDRRPELKIIITSATIDTERFAAHFGDAPVISVSGRTYPVDIRYRPHDDDTIDQPQAISDAVAELLREGPGDVLVFCSGEREIRDAAEVLAAHAWPNTEIVPLYARLSAAEQHRVFQPHTGRRIVISTNVAETSITVPGIRYVVDTGFARISRFNRRTKVQRLPIEPISQASANQRAGRCGRLGPGICVRLYSHADFELRPAFTDPEILRTNLAAVILAMANLDLGEIDAFPFLDPPDARSIRDGIALLEELGALAAPKPGSRRRRRTPSERATKRTHGTGSAPSITPLGRRLARIPLDPRLGRMLLSAADYDAVGEVIVIVAALTINDPRERPRDESQAAARAFHARFNDPAGDFCSYLRLWEYITEQRQQLSGNQFRRQCRREYLHYMRLREWADLVSQLRRVARDLGLKTNREPAPATAVHRAILPGLLSQIGVKHPERPEYRGPRGANMMIAPGSALGRSTPTWIMAGELIETNRLWARVIAPIDPSWLETAGRHLLKRTHADPWWDRQRGEVMTHETVSLLGLVLSQDRPVRWRTVDAPDARLRFILHAFVRGDLDRRYDFCDHNDATIEKIAELEAKHRRDDLLADESVRLEFFSQRVPETVASQRQFDRWYHTDRERHDRAMRYSVDDVLRPDAHLGSDTDFPDTWVYGDLEFDLSYTFGVGQAEDGVTIDIPIGDLRRVDGTVFEWNVPGFRADLTTALLRSLPRALRRELVPIPTTAAQIATELDPDERPLAVAITDWLRQRRGLIVAADDLIWDRVPNHLRLWFRVHDDELVVLAEGYDLGAIRRLLDQQLREDLAHQRHPLERDGLTDWTIGVLPAQLQSSIGHGHGATAYPALVDQHDSVAVRLFASRQEQADHMWLGTRRLLQLRLPEPFRALDRLLSTSAKLAIAVGPHPTVRDWQQDIADATVDALIEQAGGPAWDTDTFRTLEAHTKAGYAATLRDAADHGAHLAVAHRGLSQALADLLAPSYEAARRDIEGSLHQLIYDGYIAAVGLDRLADLRRYLAAAKYRIERLPTDPSRDRALQLRINALEQLWAEIPASRADSAEAETIAWDLQELRVSLFAQHIKTAYPISEKRVRRDIAQLL